MFYWYYRENLVWARSFRAIQCLAISASTQSREQTFGRKILLMIADISPAGTLEEQLEKRGQQEQMASKTIKEQRRL